MRRYGYPNAWSGLSEGISQGIADYGNIMNIKRGQDEAALRGETFKLMKNKDLREQKVADMTAAEWAYRHDPSIKVEDAISRIPHTDTETMLQAAEKLGLKRGSMISRQQAEDYLKDPYVQNVIFSEQHKTLTNKISSAEKPEDKARFERERDIVLSNSGQYGNLLKQKELEAKTEKERAETGKIKAEEAWIKSNKGKRGGGGGGGAVAHAIKVGERNISRDLIDRAFLQTFGTETDETTGEAKTLTINQLMSRLGNIYDSSSNKRYTMADAYNYMRREAANNIDKGMNPEEAAEMAKAQWAEFVRSGGGNTSTPATSKPSGTPAKKGKKLYQDYL